METNNTVNISELLVKLTRLEDQVATLSSQLESNKLTISQMKQSLSDRDSQIRELESKLILAQNSLQKTAIDKIVQCREQIKNGIDVKIVTPVLTQIQKYIESVEGLVAETKDFIDRKKAQLNEGFNATSSLVRQGPDQARVYLEKNVIEPMTAIVKNAVQSSNDHYQVSREWIEKELVSRYKVLVERISFAVKETPLNTKIILQTQIIDPALVLVGHMPNFVNGIRERIVISLKGSPGRITQVMQECLDFIMELIKKSSYWDGRQRTQAAA